MHGKGDDSSVTSRETCRRSTQLWTLSQIKTAMHHGTEKGAELNA